MNTLILTSPAHTQTLLTTCLYSWAVRVSQSDQYRLHQLCEEDVFTNKHKLSVTAAVPLAVTGYAHICMLHHTVDGDHQTWQTDTERVIGEEGKAPLGPASCVCVCGPSSFQVLGIDSRSCDRPVLGGTWKLLDVLLDPCTVCFSAVIPEVSFSFSCFTGFLGQFFLIRINTILNKCKVHPVQNPHRYSSWHLTMVTAWLWIAYR